MQAIACREHAARGPEEVVALTGAEASGTDDTWTRPEIDWDELSRSYGPALRRVVAARVPRPSVDDVLQETLVRAYRSRGRVDLTVPLWPWLVTLARRSCADHWRGYREIPSGEPHAVRRSSGPSPEDALEAVELRHVVDGVLGDMPARHRRLLTRSIVDSPAVIAADEGVSSDTVRAALARARRGFRRRYEARMESAGVMLGLPAARLWAIRLRDRMRWASGLLRDGPAWAAVGMAAGFATLAMLGVESVSSDARPASVRSAKSEPPEGSTVPVPTPDRHLVAERTDYAVKSSVGSGRAEGKRSGGEVQASSAPLMLSSTDTAVRIGPEDSYVRVRVDWVDAMGAGHGETSVEVKCERSNLVREACAVLRNVPGVESGGS
ncbi:MAG TPA: sigma-70 family RNA polymerase sigma factor [Acidimicrobiales bacterium]|nr:sigma-70 family RNA polymerase sigma factor [Acidimicrobiales bacterium]